MIEPSQERPRFLECLKNLAGSCLVPFEGSLYRFVDPRFSSSQDVVSGTGGWHAAGRWNPTGEFAVSYTSLTPETALTESLASARYFNLPVDSALPRLLVALEARFPRTLNLTNGRLRTRLRLGIEKIRGDWRRENRGAMKPPLRVGVGRSKPPALRPCLFPAPPIPRGRICSSSQTTLPPSKSKKEAILPR